MHAQPNGIWLKAAAAGSLWASVEIVIGSFLHNLRVPMAGTILAVMGISLMIGFQYQWKERGLVWRAGVICALMKSLSPSAVILGPMIGIMTEAFILEAMIRLLGRNPVGFLAGSVMAVFSALLHKVATLLVLYGFDLVTILKNMYLYAETQLGFRGPPAPVLLVYLALVYVALGLASGIMGIRAGRILDDQPRAALPGMNFRQGKEMEVLDSQRFYPALLVLHVLILVVVLFLLNDRPVYAALVLAIPYAGFVIFRYSHVLRRLLRPLLWIQLLVILAIAILFWNGLSAGSVWDPEGLMVGLKMVMRALILVLAFSAISTELKN